MLPPNPNADAEKLNEPATPEEIAEEIAEVEKKNACFSA